MARHIMLLHKVSLSPERVKDVADVSSNPRGLPSQMLNIDGILDITGTDNSRDPLTGMMDWMQKFSKVVTSLNSTRPQPRVPKPASFFTKEFQNISANNWILPKADVQGISGYFCQCCRTFSSRPIRDVGYDRTEKQKHIDFHGHIGDDLPLDDTAVNVLTNELNSFMPGIKYLRSFDLTDFFMELIGKHDNNINGVLKLIGIPARWYLVYLKEDLQWFQKVQTYVGNKMRLENAEVADFLKRTQASYAIFQTVTGTSFKWLAICITPD